MKKTINYLLAISVACCMIGSLQAQTFGAQVGLDVVNQNIDDGFFSAGAPDPGGLPAPMAGIFVEIPVSDNFDIRPAVNFSQGGFNLDNDGTDRRRIFYFGFDGDAQYKAASAGAAKILVNAGPFVNFAVGGKDKFNVGEEDEDFENLEVGSEDFFIGVNRLDVGAGVGAGVEVNNKIQIMVSYDQGFLNVLPDDTSEMNREAKNSSFGILLAWLFGN